MLKNRNDLEKKIKIIIENLNPRKDINRLVEQFKKHNIIKSQIQDILKGFTVINMLSTEMLCLLTKYLYEITGDETIDYNKWFTTFEIEQSGKYKQEIKNDESETIVFENVAKYRDDDYALMLTLEEFITLWKEMKIRYNPKTQRPLITTSSGYKTPFIDKRNKTEIKQRILKGDQIPNDIVFNIPDGIDFEYDEKNKRLIINGKVDVIDGFTRSVAGFEAFMQKPSSDYYYHLRITHWDEEKCLSFIHQQSLGSRLNALAARTYNVSSSYNKIINKINTANNSYLKGKITTDVNDIQKGLGLISYNVLFDGLKLLYPEIEKDNTKEVIKIQKKIIDGLNAIIEDNPELLESKQNDLLWLVYLIIVKDSQTESDIINKIKCIDKNTLHTIPYNGVNKKLLGRIREEIIK